MSEYKQVSDLRPWMAACDRLKSAPRVSWNARRADIAQKNLLADINRNMAGDT